MAATIYKLLVVSRVPRTEDGEAHRGRAACAVSHLLVAFEEDLEPDALSGDVGDAATLSTAPSTKFE